MKFWDSSAITPLLIEEADTVLRTDQLRADSDLLVWYGTLPEIESAICRRLREKSIDPPQAQAARNRLNILANAWFEVQPTPSLRNRALRLLRVHPLRAADAMQLAAALIAFRENTTGNFFLTGDHRLAAAATLEGFSTQ